LFFRLGAGRGKGISTLVWFTAQFINLSVPPSALRPHRDLWHGEDAGCWRKTGARLPKVRYWKGVSSGVHVAWDRYGWFVAID